MTSWRRVRREPRENGREMGSKAIGVIESTPGCACPTPAPSHRHSPAYVTTVTIAISGNRGSCVLSSTVQPLQARSRQFRLMRFVDRRGGANDVVSVADEKHMHSFLPSPTMTQTLHGPSPAVQAGPQARDEHIRQRTSASISSQLDTCILTKPTTTPPLHKHLTTNHHVLPG